MSAWTNLILAGIFEIGFAVCLKLTAGFTKWHWNLLMVVLMAISFGLLNKALKEVPIGTAYAVWTGIGAAGTAAVGMAIFSEPTSLTRIVLLVVLIACVVGLKAT